MYERSIREGSTHCKELAGPKRPYIGYHSRELPCALEKRASIFEALAAFDLLRIFIRTA